MHAYSAALVFILFLSIRSAVFEDRRGEEENETGSCYRQTVPSTEKPACDARPITVFF